MSDSFGDSSNLTELHRDALSLARQRRYREASALFALAVADQPNNPELHYHYGSCLYCLGKKEEARERWARSVELDPANPRYQRWLRRITEEIGPTVQPPLAPSPDSTRQSPPGRYTETGLPVTGFVEAQDEEPSRKAKDAYEASAMFLEEESEPPAVVPPDLGDDFDWIMKGPGPRGEAGPVPGQEAAVDFEEEIDEVFEEESEEDFEEEYEEDFEDDFDEDFKVPGASAAETEKGKRQQAAAEESGGFPVRLLICLPGGILIALVLGLLTYMLSGFFWWPVIYPAVMGAAIGGFFGFVRRGQRAAVRTTFDLAIYPICFLAWLSFYYYDYLSLCRMFEDKAEMVETLNEELSWIREEGDAELADRIELMGQEVKEMTESGQVGEMVADKTWGYLGFVAQTAMEMIVSKTSDEFLKGRTGHTGFIGYMVYRTQLGWSKFCGLLWINDYKFAVILVAEVIVAMAVAHGALMQEKKREEFELEVAARKAR